MEKQAYQPSPPQSFEPVSEILNKIYDYEYSLDEPDFYDILEGTNTLANHEELKAYCKTHAGLRISTKDLQALKNLFDQIILFLWEEKLLTFKKPLQLHLLKISSCLSKLNVPKGRAGIDNPQRQLKSRLDEKLKKLISSQNFLIVKYQRFLEGKSISNNKQNIYIVKSNDEANCNSFDLHGIIYKHDDRLDFSEILQLIKEAGINSERLVYFEELLENIPLKINKVREKWISQTLKLFKSGDYHCWAMSSTFDSYVFIPAEQWGSNYTIDIKGNIKKNGGSNAENYIDLHVFKGDFSFVSQHEVKLQNDVILSEKIAGIENNTHHIFLAIESLNNEQRKAPRKINRGEKKQAVLRENIEEAKKYIIEAYKQNPSQIPEGSKSKFIPFLLKKFGIGRDAAYKAYILAIIEVHGVTKEEAKITKLWMVKRGRPTSL